MKSVAILILIAILLTFSGIGYAQIADHLLVTGEATLEPPKIIYISNATVSSGDAAIDYYYGTILSSEVTLPTSDSTSTITVTITNNSETTKVFNKVQYIDEAYSNANITFQLSGISTGTALPHAASGENNTITFDITFEYTGGEFTDGTLSSILLFEFAEAADWDDGTQGGGSGESGGNDPVVEIGEDFAALIEAAMSEIKNSYGLNDPNKGSALKNAIKNNKLVYSTDNITGGHIKHFASDEINTHKLDFLFEFSSDTEYILYMWRLKDVESASTVIGTTEIVVYKQAYHLVGGTWEKSTTLAGHATVIYVMNNQDEEIIAIDYTMWDIGAPHTP